jgi:diguanylate cyclase (GGDEF)-like protein
VHWEDRANAAVAAFRGSAWILTDRHLTTVWVSAGSESIFGRRSIIGASAFDIVHPDDLPFVVEVLTHHERQAVTYRDRPRPPYITEGAQVRVRCDDGWVSVVARVENRLEDPAIEALIIRVDHVPDHPGIGGTLDRLAQGDPAHAVLGDTLRTIAVENHDVAFAVIWWDEHGRQIETLNMDPADTAAFTHPGLYEDAVRSNVVRTICRHDVDAETVDLQPSFDRARQRGFESVWIIPLASSETSALGVLIAWNEYDYRLALRPHMAIAVGAQLCSLTLQEHRRRQDLQTQARTDALTGLLNRAGVAAAVEALGADQLVAALYVDLDDFKPINDARGHRFGDEVLKEVGRRLSRICRGSEVVARLGGDEFVVLCPGLSDIAAAVAMAERIVAAVRAPLLSENTEINLSASVGVSIETSGAELSGLLAGADQALYSAKRNGKNQVVASTVSQN